MSGFRDKMRGEEKTEVYKPRLVEAIKVDKLVPVDKSCPTGKCKIDYVKSKEE